MFNQTYSIIAFLKETDDGVSFPFLPEQIWDEAYDIYCINCNAPTPVVTTCGGNCDETIHIPSYDIIKHGGVSSILASLIHAEGMERRRIFTVHPNNILLPIYKWYLLKHGTNISSVDEYVQRLSRVTVDICEAFHKPTILTLDRRQNFNYKTIARWLDLTPQGESKTEQCLSTLKYICQRL
jgi:hypothetical protein